MRFQLAIEFDFADYDTTLTLLGELLFSAGLDRGREALGKKVIRLEQVVGRGGVVGSEVDRAEVWGQKVLGVLEILS
jgi:hypothetical protein